MTRISVSNNSQLKHSELTELIIGVFYDVYNELGFGFLESVYRKSLHLALREKGLEVQAEVAVPVFFRGINVGDFRADLVVNDCILLELKTAETIIIAHEAQVLKGDGSRNWAYPQLRSKSTGSPLVI